MSRPGPIAAVLSLVAIVAALWVPAYFTKADVTEDPSGKVLEAGYKLYEANIPNFKVSRKEVVDGGVPREGGGRTPFQCAKIVSGGVGWFCFALSPDGRSAIAAWTSPSPNEKNATFVSGKPEFLTRPDER
jgi:hypothetical protein